MIVAHVLPALGMLVALAGGCLGAWALIEAGIWIVDRIIRW